MIISDSEMQDPGVRYFILNTEKKEHTDVVNAKT
jgi:hypothetical protein